MLKLLVEARGRRKQGWVEKKLLGVDAPSSNRISRLRDDLDTPGEESIIECDGQGRYRLALRVTLGAIDFSGIE